MMIDFADEAVETQEQVLKSMIGLDVALFSPRLSIEGVTVEGCLEDVESSPDGTILSVQVDSGKTYRVTDEGQLTIFVY